MTSPRPRLPVDIVTDRLSHTTIESLHVAVRQLPLDSVTLLAAGYTDWVANMFIYVVTGLLGFIGTLVADGMHTFIIFDSPYSDPALQSAFAHNLDIFPQLLVVMVMAGVATKPFSDQQEVTNFMLAWKALKVIIFVAVGRQLMHFGLLLTNAIIGHIFTADYGTSFGPEVLQSSLEGAAASSAGVVLGAFILSLVSVAGIVLALGVFVLREFLFNATFILLPVLGAMLFLDFGPLRSSAELAKTALRATTYMLLVGIVMAGLLQTGAAAAGAYADLGGQAAAQSQQAASDPGFGEVLEAYLFWLIGLVAPALAGIKAAAMSGLSPRKISGRDGGKSRSSGSSSGRSGEKSTRTALMEQAKYGSAKGLRSVDKHIARGAGSSAAGKFGSVAGRAKGAVGGTVANNLSEGKRNWTKAKGQAIKKGGKRTAKDVHSGTDYATRNLHQSPLDWAEAGLERYREEPVVDTGDSSGPGKREANDQKNTSGGNDSSE